jgi:hypothetical protein
MLNSGHVVLVHQWIAEIVGGTEVEKWRRKTGRRRMQQVSSLNVQKSESIRRKFKQPQKNHKRLRKL